MCDQILRENLVTVLFPYSPAVRLWRFRFWGDPSLCFHILAQIVFAPIFDLFAAAMNSSFP